MPKGSDACPAAQPLLSYTFCTEDGTPNTHHLEPHRRHEGAASPLRVEGQGAAPGSEPTGWADNQERASPPATRPPRVRAIPTVAPHQPGRSPVSPQGQGPGSPRSKALPTEEGSLPRDSRGLMTPQAEHQAPSCCEVDGSEAAGVGAGSGHRKVAGGQGPAAAPGNHLM